MSVKNLQQQNCLNCVKTTEQPKLFWNGKKRPLVNPHKTMPSIPNSNSSSHNIPFEWSPPTYCIWLIILQGFFRRSIQQKIQYRPCTKNQQCAIQRVNRNRCQYCRLKKCIAAGMSRDGEYYLTISRQSDNLITQMSTRDNRTEEMTKDLLSFFIMRDAKSRQSIHDQSN